MQVGYTVVFDSDEDGVTATVPALPGLTTFGETREEARRNAAEAIRCHIEGLLKEGQPVPAEDKPRVSIETLSLDFDLAPGLVPKPA